MPIYATAQDMLDRYRFEELVERTNLGNPRAVAITVPVLETLLSDASAEMDSILLGRPLPSNAVQVCCAIARYRAYYDSSRGDGNDRPRWALDYDNAIAGLKAYAEAVPLPTATVTAPARTFVVRGPAPDLSADELARM
jgi:phage gp36-like protein